MSEGKPLLSIGVMAHNEEKNIGGLLNQLIIQAEEASFDFYITVVASGCTDRTEDIVRTYQARDKRISLLVEPKRKGKVSAINCFLRQAKGNFLIISSADIILSKGALGIIFEEFFDSAVGMVGGRPVPQSAFGLTASLNNLLWQMHHERSLKKAKLGEFVALRNIIEKIPVQVTTDEAALEAMVSEKGFKIKYAPEAIIYNYSPKSLNQLVRQRIRNFVGHLYINKKMFYKVSTFHTLPIIFSAIKVMRQYPNKIFLIILVGCLEAYSRIVALYLFYIRKKRTLLWER